MICSKRNINIARLPNRLAIVQRFHHCKILSILINDVCNPSENPGTFFYRGLLPGLKRFPRSLHCFINIFLSGCSNFSQLLAVRRIVYRDGTSICCITKFTVHIKLVYGFESKHKMISFSQAIRNLQTSITLTFLSAAALRFCLVMISYQNSSESQSKMPGVFHACNEHMHSWNRCRLC